MEKTCIVCANPADMTTTCKNIAASFCIDHLDPDILWVMLETKMKQ